MKPIPRHPILTCAAVRSTRAETGCVLDGVDAILTRSGRSALVLALEAAGIGPGAQVLVPNYYCPTMIAPIERVGAAPVFYPLTAAGAPDVERLETWKGQVPAALLAVHFFGMAVPLGATRAFCDRRGLALIEDCAHAFYGGTAGVSLGQLGDYIIASLPKFLPTLEGGVLASRRHRLPSRSLPSPGLTAEIKVAWNLVEAAAQYGGSSVAAAIVRAVNRARHAPAARPVEDGPRPPPEDVRRDAMRDPLLTPMRLRAVERWIVRRDNARRNVERRRRNYRLLADLLTGVTGCQLLCPELAPADVPYVLPLLVPAAEQVFPRLRRAGLPVYRWDRYWPGSAADLVAPLHKWGHELIQISCHQDLEPDDVRRIADTIRAALLTA